MRKKFLLLGIVAIIMSLALIAPCLLSSPATATITYGQGYPSNSIYGSQAYISNVRYNSGSGQGTIWQSIGPVPPQPNSTTVLAGTVISSIYVQTHVDPTILANPTNWTSEVACNVQFIHHGPDAFIQTYAMDTYLNGDGNNKVFVLNLVTDFPATGGLPITAGWWNITVIMSIYTSA